MNVEEILKLIELLRWPFVILVIYFLSKKSILDFVSRYGHVQVESSVAKIILKKLKEENSASSTQIKKLRGLTGHDLWALESFVDNSNASFKYVERFNPTKKAIAYSFVEMGLLEILGSGKNRIIKPTKLAGEIVDAADKLL